MKPCVPDATTKRGTLSATSSPMAKVSCAWTTHGVPAQRPLPARKGDIQVLLHLRLVGSADHQHLRRRQLRAIRRTVFQLQQRERRKRGGVGYRYYFMKRGGFSRMKKASSFLLPQNSLSLFEICLIS